MKKIVDLWVRTNLIIKVIIGMAVGAGLSLVAPNVPIITVFGQLFINALKALAPILVAVLVCSSIAASKNGVGSRFRVVIVLYLVSTFLAAILSVVMSKLFPITLILPDSVMEQASVGVLSEIFNSILIKIVQNPISAIVEGNYLAILFWSILIGLALKKIKAEKAIDFISEFAGAISKVLSFIIQLAPVGIMSIVYTNSVEHGLGAFTDYGKLLLLLVGTMVISAFIINPIIVAVVLKKDPYPMIVDCLRESGIPAFFTRSSAANIPVNMQYCEKHGLDKDFYSVSIPLGSTINMNGAAITITIMTLATASTLGMEVPITTAILLSIVSTLGACGASGVEGGSILLIPMACSLLGIGNDIAMSVVGIGFIIGVVQDSFETALNSSGDLIFTITAEQYARKKADKKSK